ncbi:hypothetical protein IW140_000475 [Coemansia sp. RSA 1813]|nr:hypothetical protein EV178_000566 [Coemansia sp. RSA 1646]KAJ1771244.1 hypothetical protein LPJ74_002512 [Coemansia sp. RSA 1843]KAJ2092814.1 hypothetical protein IW138_000909 [Coemansia sp. RSA 986]KAJ2217686.1 hypothetical protein EV179_000171 [Coemansia sp. RSA 487]KAJ2573076.1 hypothetical protein IW140_000475 [Coemansia sp. RSA 1813]
MLEVVAWNLMESITAENEYNQHIRRFLNILLGDDPDTAHIELVDEYNVQDAALRDQLLQLAQESLSRSDEFLYRISESRDKVIFAIEQKSQLKRQLEKVAATVAAVQDLMRDTARLFEQASKLNAQLLQIDAFIDSPETQSLFRDLEKCRREYKESFLHARNLAVAFEAEPHSNNETISEDSSKVQIGELQRERDKLHVEAVEKSEQIRRLLDCARQLQLTSAQLLQI